VVVQTNTGKLFRITLSRDGAAIQAIAAVSGVSVPGGDGMLLDGGRLVVVQGGPPAQISFVKMRHGDLSGTVRDVRTSDALHGPSTIARARDLYLVVNADFANSAKPFTVAGLLRRAQDDNGHHPGDDNGRQGDDNPGGDDDNGDDNGHHQGDDNGAASATPTPGSGDDNGHGNGGPAPYYGTPTPTPTPYYGGAGGGDDNGHGGGHGGGGSGSGGGGGGQPPYYGGGGDG
jgi:hypothetical protein